MNLSIVGIKELLLNWLPFSLNLVIGILFVYVAQIIIKKRTQNSVNGSKIYFQLGMIALINMIFISLVLSTPLSEGMKGQLLSLLGITFTAAVALSSTTFLGNIMAGLMIKVLDKFKPGDFLKIDVHFGRVTELGLLHTEIQTQDRDLLTLPNIYLVSNPVKVTSSSGTVISEDISLGYDVHHNKIEKALIKAASNCNLEDAFMHIQSLGDFSVTFRIHGFLKDVKTILSTKAKLREEILDCLHRDGIEIVSPNFMNQRVFDNTKTFIPKYERDTAAHNAAAENIIFDKADEAESIENLKARIEQYQEKIKEVQKDESLSKEDKELRINNINAQIETVKNYITNKSNS
ncbi:MAG: mechanosensitive ion channel [Oligoflexia bacterium]|nr:mechanosensitive ion channel [Oligoflexia bacterium]